MGSVKKLTCILSLLATIAAGQVQTDYLVHKRGMLNQAVYKTGALGRVAYQNQGTTEIGVPSFEWPANSSIVLDGITYTGQHNSFGGGVQAGIAVAVGWTIVPYLDAVPRALDATELSLIIIGGIAYTIGALVYAAKRPNPWPRTFGYHEVFHALTLVGAATHLAAVLSIVRKAAV